MKTYIIVSEKTWHDDLIDRLKQDIKGNWVRIERKEDFTKERLDKLKPDKVFIPHWSQIIQPAIYDNFECVVFHITDLPFGRGGSPLQNLIVRNYENTVISALRVSKGIDTGDVYLKKPMSLLGTAEEIFIRSTRIVEEMINEIIHGQYVMKKQEGEVVAFKRRAPDDGNMSGLDSIEEVYNYIRMLDCEGYPNAFVEVGNFRFEFSRASLKGNKSIISDVRITEK